MVEIISLLVTLLLLLRDELHAEVKLRCFSQSTNDLAAQCSVIAEENNYFEANSNELYALIT